MADIGSNMVVVRQAYKKYGNDIILNGLNMTVERGSIYAFLGPSGCGKTTLLKCIVGRGRLEAGEIIAGVKNKSEVGYMPQETALLEELSIGETLSYYGRMFSLRETDLVRRRDDLLAFLDLPPESHVINELSGGQKRRLSLCIALLHNPVLLILDEPTVGVDPVLSHSIWQRLIEMSSMEKKTIIVTTHYIEEARQANKVGMMRSGVLLVEGKASSIMTQHGCDTLEEVFLQLSYKQENTDSSSDFKVIKNYPKPSVKPKLPLTDKNWFRLNHFISNIMKNIYFLKRSTMAWILLLINPLIQCVLFEMTVNEPKGLKLGIVNEEVFNIQGNCNVFSNETCFPSSCRFMDTLKMNDIELIPYNDENDASRDVEKNNIWGFLHISQNFTEALYYRIMGENNLTDEIIEQSEVDVIMDKSNMYFSILLDKIITTSFLDYLDLLQAYCNWPVHHVKVPIKFNEPIYGENNPKFSDFSVVGILLLLEFFLPVAFSLATLKDKINGVLERNLIAGMTNLEILAGHACLTVVIFSIQTSSMLVVLFGIFDHKINGSYVLLVALIYLIGISGMCFGYMVAVTCDCDTTAIYLALGTFVALANLSGMFWPVEGMHYLLRSVNWLFPLVQPSNAFRGITIRDWHITHPVVYTGFLSLTTFIVVLCCLICIIITMKKRTL